MFRKSERKIVAAIMAAIVFLMIGTFSIIYFSSYKDVYDTNQEMLELYIASYEQNGNPNEREDAESSVLEEDGTRTGLSGEATGENMSPGGPPEERNDLDKDHGSTYALSTFYSVEMTGDEVVSIDDNDGRLYSQEELTELAWAILNMDKTAGVYGSMVYRVEKYDEYSLVAMMDNTLMEQSVTSLVKYTTIFGGIAVIITFFIAVFLARQIVRPMRENHEKQKQFISDAGHELKTPIAVMNTNIEVLSREMGDNPWLDNIRYENERMTVIVRQLLDLSRAENDKPEMRPVDFSRIVMREILSFEIIAFEQDLILCSDAVRENMFVQGDEEQLGRLVAILLDNAIEHSLSEGKIDVQLCSKGKKVCLMVSNEGEPIPEKEKDKIFERFYRRDDSRSGEDGHYGLGLAIARAIVTTHHGEITVSCEDGRVTFAVKLARREKV